MNGKDNSQQTCNCRVRENCSLNGECLKKNIVYQATVTSNQDNREETYIGMSENIFKTRYNNHKTAFKYRDKRTATELSNFVWDLKDKNINYSIK